MKTKLNIFSDLLNLPFKNFSVAEKIKNKNCRLRGKR
jgi:hypothetical protein